MRHTEATLCLHLTRCYKKYAIFGRDVRRDTAFGGSKYWETSATDTAEGNL